MQEGKIHKSIIGVMSEIGAIGKDQKNAQQGFMYRGVDSVMNVLQPLFVKHGVFIVPEILEHSREERTTQKGGTLLYSICKIKYTFFADDGSYIDAVVIGEGMDSGDKATNKAMAIAFKYACFQTFCIPTEEIIDPDSVTPDALKPKAPPAKPHSGGEEDPLGKYPASEPMDGSKWTGFWKKAGEAGWTKAEVEELAGGPIGDYNTEQVKYLWDKMCAKRKKEATNA